MPPKRAASAVPNGVAAAAAPTRASRAATVGPKKTTVAAETKVAANTSKKRKSTSDIEEDDTPAAETKPIAKKVKTPAAATAAATEKEVNGVAKKPAATKSAVAKKAAGPAKKTTTKKDASAEEVKADEPPAINGARKRKSPADADDEGDEASETEEPAAKRAKKGPAAKKAPVAKKAAETKKTATTAKKPVTTEKPAPSPKEKKPTAAAAAAAAPKKAPAANKEPVVPKIKHAKILIAINEAPTDPLEVFVFGEGSSGELGLGSVKVDGKKPLDVKRPRVNAALTAANVVQLATGGMHSVALTKDNKILTWGVNDQGALGRDTTWDGGLIDMDANKDDDDSDDDDDDDSGLNPKESTPTEVDATYIAPETVFVAVAASDSASWALTADGKVYGWGAFRGPEGILGFSKDVLVQRFPVHIPDSKKIKQIVAGSNHVMTLDKDGKVDTWGAGEQFQLGRRIVERDAKQGLRPGGLAFRKRVKIAKLACGSYHSFAIDVKGNVHAWGLNNFGELGVDADAGEEGAVVLEPMLVEGLESHKIVDIAGGEHHSIACTEDGKLLAWGRVDGFQTGLPLKDITKEMAIFDDHDKPRILKKPTVIPGVENVVSVAAGVDNNFALTEDGDAYSWGFSANYQTGQGASGDDVETPTLIDNTAVQDKMIVYAGAGGQFSILAAPKKE